MPPRVQGDDPVPLQSHNELLKIADVLHAVRRLLGNESDEREIDAGDLGTAGFIAVVDDVAAFVADGPHAVIDETANLNNSSREVSSMGVFMRLVFAERDLEAVAAGDHTPIVFRIVSALARARRKDGEQIVIAGGC